MNNKGLEKGIYTAALHSVKVYDSQIVLKLFIYDVNRYIFIDIDDIIYETIGRSLNKKELEHLKKLLPSNLKISNFNEVWEIRNEGQLFSEILSKF